MSMDLGFNLLFKFWFFVYCLEFLRELGVVYIKVFFVCEVWCVCLNFFRV